MVPVTDFKEVWGKQMATRKVSKHFCHIVLYLGLVVISIQSTTFGSRASILSMFLAGLLPALLLYVPLAFFMHFALFPFLPFLNSSAQQSSPTEPDENIVAK